MFESGQPCSHYVLVQAGTVVVSMTDPEGHSMVLYRLVAGEACILTTSALLSGENYAATAVTESEVKAILVPKAMFFSLLASSDQFRMAVFAEHGKRIIDLIRTLGSVRFGRIDRRLKLKLLSLAGGNGLLTVTHNSLAMDLGTSREVVSRQLKDFQRRGWIVMKRRSIQLLEPFFAESRP